jgi:Protein of unknown function (DUF2804)
MPAADQLVEDGTRHYGRLPGRPADVNPLDEFGPVGRVLRRQRLKQWIGFTLLHPDWYTSVIMQDAQYLASSEIYSYDRERGTLSQREATRRGGSLALPADLRTRPARFTARGYALTFDLTGADGYHLVFDIAPGATGPGFRGELHLDAAGASAPLSVSSRLPGGRMYTHKALYPVSGTLRVGDRDIVFDPARDLAILDEHHSLLPYRTSWLWGTFGMPTPDGPVGANFAARTSAPGAEEESCLWLPGSCAPLAEIGFTPTSADPLAPWRVRSRDGRLDVTFEPDGRKEVRHQFGVVAIDYFQLCGRYHGTLCDGERSYQLQDVHGVCESMRARF